MTQNAEGDSHYRRIYHEYVDVNAPVHGDKGNNRLRAIADKRRRISFRGARDASANFRWDRRDLFLNLCPRRARRQKYRIRDARY